MLGQDHDPIQLLAQLRQTLSADKLSVGFFLGAGCPCAVRIAEPTGGDRPLIPDIKGITTKVQAAVAALAPLKGPHAALMKTFDEDSIKEPNIELVLNRVRGFRDVAGTTGVRGLTSDQLKELDVKICEEIRRIVTCALPDQSTPYHALANYILRHRSPFVEVFTTNYDVLIEEALEDRKVPYFDGFVGSRRPFFDQQAIEQDILPSRWSRLWKLHGSIRWYFNKDKKVVFKSEKESPDDELLIHPSHLKYDESRRMPYFVMIDRLRYFLRHEDRPVALFISGYSFGDEHLNAAIVESLNANASAACFALQHGVLKNYPKAIALAKEYSNLSVLASDRAIIRRQEGQWTTSATTEPSVLAGVFDVGAAAGAASPARRTCTHLLGDFKAFGEFLDQFSGLRQPLGTTIV